MPDRDEAVQLGIDKSLFPSLRGSKAQLKKEIDKETRTYRIKAYKLLLGLRIAIAIAVLFMMKVMADYSFSYIFIAAYFLIQSLNIYYFTKDDSPTYWIIFLSAIVDVVYVVYVIVNHQADMGFGLLVINLVLIAAVLPFYPMLLFAVLSIFIGGITLFVHNFDYNPLMSDFWMNLFDYLVYSEHRLLILSLIVFLFGLVIIIHWAADWAFKNEIRSKIRRIQLKRFLSINQVIIEQLNTGLVIVDNNGSIISMNRNAIDLLGIDDMESSLLLRSISKELHRRFVDWSRTSIVDTDPYIHPYQSNELFVNFLTTNDSQYGESIIILERVEDVKVKNRKATLAALGRLTAGIAHEIRNPLSSINSAAQLMEEDEGIGEQNKSLLKVIGKNVNRTNLIIEDILGLFSNKQSSYRLINVKNILVQFSKEFLDGNSEKDFKISVLSNIDRRVYCMFDESQLNQVLWNLAYNSIRYADAENLEITMSYTIKDNKTLVLDIYDNGKGIDAHEANKIFEPFYTSSNSGTGLGLYLTKEICGINQSNIVILSKEESVSGAHFRITMPVFFTPNIQQEIH